MVLPIFNNIISFRAYNKYKSIRDILKGKLSYNKPITLLRKKVFIIVPKTGRQPGETFFIKEKGFFYSWASLMALIASQNLVAYSVNMADNVMLGSYSQSALCRSAPGSSGAAAIPGTVL